MTCKGCGYAVRLSDGWYCDYINITGHRRPCPPGKECTVRAVVGRDKKKEWRDGFTAFRRSWDTEKARVLYGTGKLDREIAAEVGTTPGAVGLWRRTMGLPSNWERRKAELRGLRDQSGEETVK